MSGRADIIALAQTLGLESTDVILLDRYYTESLLALGDTDVMLEATFILVTSGTARYTIPVEAVRVVAAFFGTREILRTTIAHLEGVSRTWQDDTGTPMAYLEEHEDVSVIRLYPIPNVSSVVVGPVDKFGVNYPTNTLLLLTADRSDLAPPWLDIPLAFGLLNRELVHSSSHRDPLVVEAVKRLGQLARTLGGAP
jgi:hypothetical protein